MWKSKYETPGPGVFVGTDGIRAWIFTRETNHPLAWFTLVRWWKKMPEELAHEKSRPSRRTGRLPGWPS